MNSENNTRKRVPKPVKRRQNVKKIGSGFVLLILAVVLAIGGTLAFIITNTEPVDNKFTPGVVSCVVDEKFDESHKVKSDVKIKNTGNTAAYIRATYVVTWKADNGTVNAKQPEKDKDYTIIFADNTGWIQIGDYWYFESAVAPEDGVTEDGLTDVLIETCKLVEGVTPPEGYHLSVEIIASAIQSEPKSAVTEEWKVNVVDGKIAAKGA